MVTAADSLRNVRQRCLLSPSPKLMPTPLTAGLRACIQIELQVGMGEHHVADVAAVHDDAASATELALFMDEDGAYPLERAHARGPLTDGLRSDQRRHISAIGMHAELSFAHREVKRKLLAEPCQGPLIRPSDAILMGQKSCDSVHSSGIDIAPAEVVCQAQRQRALPRPRRPIDGNNRSLPATKPRP